jgi:hypothetical protein
VWGLDTCPEEYARLSARCHGLRLERMKTAAIPSKRMSINELTGHVTAHDGQLSHSPIEGRQRTTH